MLDWLKKKFGEEWTDEIDNEARQELAKWGVPKADFNAKAKKVGEYERKINDLQAEIDNSKQGMSEDDFNKQIQTLKDEHAAEIAQIKLANAVEKALVSAHAHNPATVMPLLQTFLQDAKMDENGNVEGLDDQIRHLSEDAGTAFLFDKSAMAAPDVAGAEPANPGMKAAGSGKDTKDMSYDELCEYLAENPDAQL